MAKIDLNDYLEKLTEPEDRETVANRAYQRELFEQYVTKDGNFPEQRAQLLEDFRAGKELTGPKGLRRKLGAFDLEYFGRAYLAHYFVRPSPKFHGELDRIWREGVLKSRVPIKQYLQKFPKWGRFGVTSVTPFLLLPVHPEGCTPAHRT